MSSIDGSKERHRRPNGRGASATDHVVALARPIDVRRRVPRDRKNRNGGRIGTQDPVRRRRTINLGKGPSSVLSVIVRQFPRRASEISARVVALETFSRDLERVAARPVRAFRSLHPTVPIATHVYPSVNPPVL